MIPALVLTLASLAPPPACEGGADAALDPQVVTAVQAVLTPPASGGRPEAARMEASLKALGPQALPVVVALLAGEVEVPHTAAGTLEEPVHPIAVALRDSVLRASLDRFEPSAVVAHLAQRASGDASVDLKLFAAGTLGGIEDRRACAAVLTIAGSIEPIHLLRSYVQQTLEQALAAQVVWRPAAAMEIEQAARGAEPELLCVLVRAVARQRSARSVEFLAQQLGRRTGADAVILSEIGRLAGDGGLGIEPTTLVELRTLVSSPDPAVQRAAVTALGRLRDAEAFSDVVGLLLSADPLVASAARWSLTGIAGTDLGSQPGPWIEWQAREQAWWLEQAPDLLEALHSDAPGEVYQALTELIQHPLQRHDSAEAIGPLCAHYEADLARAACGTLGRLGSSRPLSWLLAALSSDEIRVRQAAQGSLCRLTGLDLPPTYAAWSEVIAR